MDHAAGADQRGPPAVLSRPEAMIAADTVVISGLPFEGGTVVGYLRRLPDQTC